MAQEFASDNSKTGLFSRLKLSNHRGFFSFIFVTLSIIFILITFAAVQQQQTTQSKAARDLCTKVDCSAIKIEATFGSSIEEAVLKCEKIPCCNAVDVKNTFGAVIGKSCKNDSSATFYCSNLAASVLCTAVGWNPYCEWDSSNSKCVDKGSVIPPVVPPTTGTLEAQCNSYGLGANGEVNCSAKAAQNNVNCKWVPTAGSTTLGTCVSSTSTGGTTTANCTSCYTDKCGSFDAITNPKTCCSGFYPKSASTKDSRLVSCVLGTPSTIISTGVACNGIEGYCLKDTSGKALPSTGACSYPGKPNGEYKVGYCPGGAETRCCATTTTNPPGVGGDPYIYPPQPPTGGTGNVELDLKLSYQGIITLPTTKTQLKMKVKIVDGANNEKVNNDTTFTADNSGIWSGKVTFSDVDLSQKYYILIKGPMHVQKKICKADAADPNPGYYSCQFGNITLTSGINTFDLSKVKMLVGDLDQNGLVNREDTGPLLSALLLDLDQRKSSAILEKLDLNLDGIVEPKDWSLMLEALKIKYDEK